MLAHEFELLCTECSNLGRDSSLETEFVDPALAERYDTLPRSKFESLEQALRSPRHGAAAAAAAVLLGCCATEEEPDWEVVPRVQPGDRQVCGDSGSDCRPPEALRLYAACARPDEDHCPTSVSRGKPCRVSFCSSLDSTVPITPYSQVYGVHPRLFHFDRHGGMQPTPGVSSAEMRQVQEWQALRQAVPLPPLVTVPQVRIALGDSPLRDPAGVVELAELAGVVMCHNPPPAASSSQSVRWSLACARGCHGLGTGPWSACARACCCLSPPRNWESNDICLDENCNGPAADGLRLAAEEGCVGDKEEQGPERLLICCALFVEQLAPCCGCGRGPGTSPAFAVLGSFARCLCCACRVETQASARPLLLPCCWCCSLEGRPPSPRATWPRAAAHSADVAAARAEGRAAVAAAAAASSAVPVLPEEEPPAEAPPRTLPGLCR